MRCKVKGCKEKKDIQYLTIYPNDGKPKREYYCQEHLRRRIFGLELIRLSNKIKKNLNI